ncbi:hypothetical protein QAD02_017989 [Eretmocerus hayati]|uniref:Uncharacterized protein n=2 Tax=Eretmocerus hayati TaxID=131215 RepID=A0ACC2PIG0_9HYME|nr:hypothetical protein QAD02_014672 [Eretmocerus hayati]KAJ8682197.1 hypothetical protein QAD02_017989 [Eretmocerus hayati]
MNAHVSCNVANCQSSYNNVYSLIRHMRKIHDESSTSNLRQDTSTPPVENSEIEMNEDRNVVDEIAPILNSSSENVPDESHDAPEESVDPDLSSEKLSTMVLNCALLFVTQLYAFSGTNRAAVHAIITSMCAMYIGRCFEFLQKKVRGGSELDNMFNIIKNGFKMFKTEYLTFKYLQKIGCLFLPTKITIQSCYAFRKRKFRSRRVIRKRRMSVIQIDEVLKKFLELPGVFSAIEENVNVSTADPSPSFFNGSYWKSISTKFVGKTVLPLVMYFDDFEINNPLGSRKVKSKIGAVYCSVLGIPPRFASQLENILLVQLHKYSDHKQLGNKIIFRQVIRQLRALEKSGIDINVNNQNRKVYFVLPFIAGDNLGLNTILGFSPSFSSDYCCRICTVSKSQLQSFTREDFNLLRNESNYLEHSSTSSFGIRESCVFNEISNFHVANNPSVDPMHDLLEGVCRVDVGRILNYLINVKKYFEFSVLEERMECYSKNSPDSNLPSLSRESIKNERIVTSASEMYYLVFNLPLMIGDLVPSSDRAWQLFLLLRKITCIVFAHSVTHEQINSFGNLVTSYLNLYKALFKKTFRPKHHILLHYKRLMLKYGPLKILSCFRYEAKHRQLKQCSGATTSRVCPDYTIGVKHQLQLCYRFVKGEGFLSKIEYSPVLSKLCDVKNRSCLTNLVPNNLLQSNCYSWIRTGGTYYSLGCFINTHGIDGFPKFGKIEHIIVDDSERVYFVFKKTSISQINQKLSAYEIHEKDTYGCVEQSSLKDYECYYGHKMTDGKLYVPRYFY